MTKARIARVCGAMDELGLDCALITSYENYRYLSGFSGSNCALIITRGECFALTDSRYDVQIRTEAPLFTPVITKRSKNEHIADLLKRLGAKRMGYESSHMTDRDARALRSSGGAIEWVSMTDFIEDIRMVKDSGEIDNIRRAAAIADDALEALIKRLKPGITEREAAARLEYEMAMRGSSRPAFETIAASGVRGAMPHAQPTDAAIPENGLLTLDFGACFCGYMSDITRTLRIGAPEPALCELWDVVFEVQRECCAMVRPGITARELDEYERELFCARGYSEYIMHSLGHGVGLAIHESPAVSKNCTTQLRENMVITIEPGLYVPGLGGVRIEDTILVTAGGGEALTKAPKQTDIILR